MKYLTLLLLVVTFNANAEVSVLFGGWSHHYSGSDYEAVTCDYYATAPANCVKEQKEFNESHNVLGLRYDHNDWYISYHRFTNSFNNITTARTLGYNFAYYKDLTFSASVNHIEGYRDDTRVANLPIYPFIPVTNIRYDFHDRFAMDIAVTPIVTAISFIFEIE